MECPVCNGFFEIAFQCERCQNKMTDKGKVMDYYDSYSAYLDTDLLKKNDGYMASISDYQCPHLLVCPSCGFDEIKLIGEQEQS